MFFNNTIYFLKLLFFSWFLYAAKLKSLQFKGVNMARRSRLLLSGTPLHIIQRGNNRSVCFYSEDDYVFYINLLQDLAETYDCKVHAWCLMTNHVHLLLTPGASLSAGLFMKGLGQRYVQYINRTYQRTGTVWEGRYRSCLVQQESYLMACYRYIEMNPVRAGMVDHPAEYRWTSYRTNAQLEPSELITPHDCYIEFGSNTSERDEVYRRLFKSELQQELIDQIRGATNGNYVFGTAKFASQIAQTLGKRTVRALAGRPKK